MILNNNELYNTALDFRTAMEETRRCGDIIPYYHGFLTEFPRGCCDITSDFLQRYLEEQYSFKTVSISGEYGYGYNAESHAWLETEDGTVIDITGDQYKYKRIQFDKPVYVGSRQDGFHDKFEVTSRMPYEEVIGTFYRDQFKEEQYQNVLRHLKRRG